MERESKPHLSVMREEFLAHFAGQKIARFFEGTVGAGGHARALLEAHPEVVRYVGCDRDPVALEIASAVLAPWRDRVELVRADYRSLDQLLDERGIETTNGFFLT